MAFCVSELGGWGSLEELMKPADPRPRKMHTAEVCLRVWGRGPWAVGKGLSCGRLIFLKCFQIRLSVKA